MRQDRASYDIPQAPDWSRWPSRPIKSPRYIVTCTRIRAQNFVEPVTLVFDPALHGNFKVTVQYVSLSFRKRNGNQIDKMYIYLDSNFTNVCNFYHLSPFSPHDALKHHFASLKNYLIS